MSNSEKKVSHVAHRRAKRAKFGAVLSVTYHPAFGAIMY